MNRKPYSARIATGTPGTGQAFTRSAYYHSTLQTGEELWPSVGNMMALDKAMLFLMITSPYVLYVMYLSTPVWATLSIVFRGRECFIVCKII